MNIKLISAALAATFSASLLFSVSAEETENIPKYYAAYYDNSLTLTGMHMFTGQLSDGELNALTGIYMPDTAETARVYSVSEDGAYTEYADDDENTVTILHTNDMHGSLTGGSGVIGLDKVAALKELIPGALLADGGDATQGIAYASLTSGADVIKTMNAAQYDVMAAGNHEFDYGIDTLLKNAETAEFPILSANTFYEDSPLLAVSYSGGESNGQSYIIETNGKKIGFFGITTANTSTSTNPDGIKGIEFKDETETAKEIVNELTEQGADAIVAITHVGSTDAVDCTSYDLAEALSGSGLDAIIDAHSHTLMTDISDGILISQTGSSGTNVGMMELSFDENGNVTAEETMLSPEFFNNIESDEEVLGLINSVNESQSAQLNERIAETTSTLWGGYINNIAEARASETNLGNLIADSMIYATKNIISEEYSDMPVVAIENGGGIRETIHNGTITKGDIINVLPFANTVMYKEVTPAALYDIMELSVSSVTAQDSETGMLTAEYSGGFLQIGGMSIIYDPSKTENKVISITLDVSDAALDRSDTTTKLLLASNDYLIAGGNDYKMLGDLKTLGEGGGLDSMLIDYIMYLTDNDTKPLDLPVTDGRIRTVREPADYTATLHITDASGNPASEQNITYYVDGEENSGTTDSEGLLKITVSDGPHAVKLSAEQEEVYINNYSGAGLVEIEGSYPVYYPTLSLK